ncbi:response regulator transcription factor [Acidovorax sp. Leaf78]|jgi:DNA-binding NarL/FixJ family response regulator|uniref:response regulator n=1 Tax=unclassified Acidovorax TaxID=2684926 RepID=UPI0006FF70F9|nr:response regulator transcription factor [Acidovorax sp. Leaf78]KQO20093.1 two-component system response regulator [Acidovorax sp. Leaf78]
MKAILLIDDHSLFRAGIAMVLANGLQDVEIHQAASLEQALRLSEIAPTLILLDVQLQGLSGLEGIGLLLRKWPNTRIVVVSAYDMPDRIEQARERGAVVFLSKTENPERLLQNVQMLLRDGAASVEVTGTKNPASLTPRQLEVLDLLSQGLSNKMIGRRLSLSEHTVRGHVQATLAALSASSRSEAVFVARRQGLIL